MHIVEQIVDEWENDKCPDNPAQHEVCDLGCLTRRLINAFNEALHTQKEELTWGHHMCIDGKSRPYAGIFCSNATCWPQGVKPLL